MSSAEHLLDYEKLKVLGTGTFGRVFLVRDKNNLKYYAMKILRKSVIMRLKQMQHVYNEKEILQKVNSPFIVNLVHTFKDRKNLYFLFEYVPGGEIFTYLRNMGRFTLETTKFYIAEIVLMLEYLHSMNIVYRDLKPENLLLDRFGHLKLTDFGFAKILDDNRTYTLCGTPEYLAPEIIKGKGHGSEVDWWALGVLIYEMLAGYPPFYDDNPFGIYEKILMGKVTFPPHFRSASRDIVKKFLSVDRTRRLGSLIGGVEEVKSHKFFDGINWEELSQKLITPPFSPSLEHEGDASHFENYEDEAGYDYYLEEDIPDPYSTEFQDF